MDPEDTPPAPTPGLIPTPHPDQTDAARGEFVPKFPVVGIGASAGGLDAILALLKRVTCDSMAYVYVQHLAPHGEVPLKELLAKHTPAELLVAADNMAVQPNKFYVAPSEHEITIDRGYLHLRKVEEGSPHLPVDTFMRSLAIDYRSAAIGIVLSGANTDGTLGLQAIKDEGGITFVQDPTTAMHANMPQSALDSGFADFCLSPAEIGDELMRLSSHPYVARVERPKVFKKEPLQRIFGLLRDVFAVDFASYKQSSIERRIERRMALLKVESLDDYAHALEKNSVELNLLYHDLLIGVTSFFRDAEPFEAMKTVVFPRLLEGRDPEVPLRVWVPGCSTGEEPYSIAMILLEYLGDRAGRHRIQIFGTDIDEHSLERARQGVYPQNIEADVTPARLQRFFAHAEKGYQISRQIREMVVFARHNLGKDPPFSRLDLVSCRNVLIYLQPQLQKKIIRVFHYGLNATGMLLVGLSESVPDDLFQPVDRKLKIYVKKNVPAHATFDVVFGGMATAMGEDRTHPRPEGRTQLSTQQIADRKVIEKYGPPGVVVTENMDIVQFRGRTGPYLEPTPGNATLSLLRLARPEFIVELRSVVKRALSEALPASSAPVHLKDSAGKTMTVRIDVLPLFDAASHSKSLLVLFNHLDGKEAEASAEAAQPEEPQHARIHELERELATTKEYLQTTIEELETTNEELQSTNEELQSSNEELQSTNEELSTSKEELQSTNEELTTVNDELHHRLTELSVSNDDLQNLLASSGVITVLVGSDLRIRRFSIAEKLLHLVAADVGRPVSYLAGSVRVQDLSAAVGETVASVSPRTVRARASDGNEYDLRIAPYKTADQAIRGALLEFQNRRPARPLPLPGEIHGWGDAVLAAVPQPLLVLDGDLRVFWANELFFDTLLLDKRIFGNLLLDAWGGPMESNVRLFLEDAVAQWTKETEVTVAHPFSRPAPASMKWSVKAIPALDDRPRLLVVVMQSD